MILQCFLKTIASVYNLGLDWTSFSILKAICKQCHDVGIRVGRKSNQSLTLNEVISHHSLAPTITQRMLFLEAITLYHCVQSRAGLSVV